MNVGIEIEFTGVKRSVVANELAKLWDSRVEIENFEYVDGAIRQRYIIIDKWCKKKWCLLLDKSIRPDCANGHITLDYDEYMCELVTPVLSATADWNNLQEALECICKLGGFVNETCGLHMHIDCPEYVNEVVELLQKVIPYQKSIAYKFGVSGNRLSRYCKMYDRDFLQEVLDTREVYKDSFSIETIQDILYETYGEGVSRDNPKNPARYFMINLDSIHKLNTIEFRFFNATLSIMIIKMYYDYLIDLIYEYV